MDDNLRFKWFARVPRKSGENREAEHTAPNKKKKNKTNSIKRRVLLLFA